MHSRPAPTRPSLFLLLALVVLASLLVLLPGERAGAASVPTSVCARYDRGVSRGFCVRDAAGRIYWLGTLRGYDDVEMYCIDYLFATDWAVGHRKLALGPTLPTSIGGTVGAPTVAALNALITRHPADGADDVTAAAIGLIIRQVMGDVRRGSDQPIPGGLTVAGAVKAVGFVPAAVLHRARELWDVARRERGPWRLTLRIDPGRDGKVTAGERVRAVARGTNGSGHPQGMRLTLRYTGFTGPATVHLGPDGTALVRMTAPRAPGRASVRARVGDAPATLPLVFEPTNWARNPRPGAASPISQRGLLGRQAPVVAHVAATTQIVKSRPRLVTQASSTVVGVGAEVSDAVTLTGSGGAPGSFSWSLLGPVPVQPDGTCPGADGWADAPVITSGTVPTHGDGTYRTPPHTVAADEVGCLTYVESTPETATAVPASTPPGMITETVLVPPVVRQPCVSTIASRGLAEVGARIFDHVRVGCISATDRLIVRWTAHGPLAPRPGASGAASCSGIRTSRWLSAPVAARGSLTVRGPGRYATRPFLVRAPGCFTFSEQVRATSTTRATATPPGVAVETLLVTRPPVPEVPEVPTGPTRATPAWLIWRLVGTVAERVTRMPVQPVATRPARHLLQRYRAPERARPAAGRLLIARLGVDAPVDGVGLDDGVMAIPASPARVGWLRGSAAPGDVLGSSVLAGHVSDTSDRPGPLAGLRLLRTGDTVEWIDAQGDRHRFRVRSVARYSRAEGLPAAVFRADGPRLLRVITCGGRVAGPGGSYHYRDNLVVTAEEAR